MERVRGIEPLSLAWKAKVIPLYDTRKIWRKRWELNPQTPYGVGQFSKLRSYHLTTLPENKEGSAIYLSTFFQIDFLCFSIYRVAEPSIWWNQFLSHSEIRTSSKFGGAREIRTLDSAVQRQGFPN